MAGNEVGSTFRSALRRFADLGVVERDLATCPPQHRMLHNLS